MKKLKAFLGSSRGTVLLLILAAGLLIAGGIGAARAALTAFSENRVYEMELKHVKAGLRENGEAVEADHRLLEKLTADGEEIKPGKEYPEVLTVTNQGTIDMYVRVSIYRYWLDADGNKDQTLSPALIGLNLTPGENWMIDSAAATAERTVLYYQPLLPVGEETDPFSDILVIDPAMAEAVTETKEVNGDYTVIRRTYDYDGCQFVLEVRADAVQTHNAEEAILSAWGQKMSVRDGRLSFKEAE